MNNEQTGRRAFLKTVAAAVPLIAKPADALVEPPVADGRGPLKLSCNLYSFNEPLTKGTMSLDDVIRFCSDVGFAAVDPTGYYFPAYPAIPPDAYLYALKQKAFRLGLDISGTGVRNDFTVADPARRRADIELVKQWVGVAARLDAPVLRVFSGKSLPEGYRREEVTGWLVDALGECAAYASEQGVMLVLQNHADFIQTSDQLLDILHAVNSDWLSVNLDIGSFRQRDPYAEVARVAPLAATWQLKENLFINDREEPTDLNRIMQIVRASGYRGYLPIETLGKGDPRVKVPAFYARVKKALEDVL